ncbi:hypothetical protein PHAVU_001G051000 [Phaseolus vulgaris]|uniref:C2 NT-type domain-containing protein n=1 Tax=Phaseolus vulgaris TaxID=3885 RepID=V7CVB8_PHAVU|nr:hypothetical protein PHAVU_001G051000g [Phaseolus vulgaris]ESW33200.1 hypothetical protein PHAVU_001G051000g [Phaseolus vulgaris]
MLMENWRPCFEKYYVVKLTQLRFEFGATKVGALDEDIVALQITGTATNIGKLSSFSSSSSSSNCSLKLGSTHTTLTERVINSKAPILLWDARDLAAFDLVINNGTLHMMFLVLHGEGDVGEYEPEMVVVGEVSMSITMAELMLEEEMKNESNSCEVQRTLPVQLKMHGLFLEASLSVSLSLLKLKNFDDDLPLPRTFVSKGTKIGENNGKFDQVEELCSYESDELAVFNSDDSSDESTTTSSSDSSSSIGNQCEGSKVSNESERFMDSDTETLLDTMQRSWSMLPWNRSFKGWTFRRTTSRKQEPLTSHPSHFTKLDELSTQPYFHHTTSGWENKEFWSRDGQAKLKTNVFFASFDQRSKQACGESACTTLAVFIAHWLHSNHNMPTRAQFDSLIKRGSAEWIRLSHNDHYLKLFPDKHFDLETVLKANIRPVVVLPQNSYTGFFSPEKFQCLEGAMSFDDIWDEIARKDDEVDQDPRIYIVSWNDHFFVLKVDVDACYVIDTLGERLYEGCQKAFVMKFDGSSSMHEQRSNKQRGEIVCKGKECCKEFIKRFLAAIPLRQLEEEESKEVVYNPYFHRQLQIDFHYSLLSSFSSPSSMGEPLQPNYITRD